MRRLSAKAKFYITAVIICLLLLLFLLPSAPVKQDKATWLWDAAIIRSESEEILDFSGREGVTTIFLQIQESVPTEDYRRFVRSAHEANIAVHALGGAPDWAYADQREEGGKLMSWLEEYNMESKPEERFQGVQLDVEPYVLRRWEREQEQVVREWSRNMESWVQEARRQGLEISAAVPFWLDSIPGPEGSGNFSRWMLEQSDAVAVMSYRDDGEKMYELSREELEQADELGKSVWIGMELTDTKEGDHLTFHGKSAKVMKNEAHRAAALGTEHPSFAGLAVHHYQAWHRKTTAMTNENDNR
ncbi:hypothetical protein SAMN05661091_3891 [Paenibacillus uliginis N3/975]|uniref:DUF4434 domain-containing protein n=1 Tax=Paenibacillus uliginis N3/975 TaxID=1313296 RepID=A0A1X7HJE8_9BACL|nr:hypothetical protein [Paenibacillus uliginis]SMF87745.1 hypothetical protein SAMN05661091_3891 [Paenibacillus uliginis N3/975]